MAMLSRRAKEAAAVVVALLAVCCLCVGVGAQTRFGYYDLTCPGVESVVASAVRFHTQSDATIPAGLLRLHFHDCFVRVSHSGFLRLLLHKS
jgi:peroxidase